MGRRKKQFQMRLEVKFVEATPEQSKEAIRLLALMFRKFREKRQQSSLPARSNKYPAVELEAKSQIKCVKRGLEFGQGNNRKDLSLDRERSFPQRQLDWLPGTDACENEFPVERPIKPAYLALPDLQTAPIGVRLRFLRKRHGLTIPDIEKATGIGHNAISALERGAVPPKPWVLGPILTFYGQDAAAVFPGEGDIFDRVLPPTDLGAWLANFRLRKGLQLKDLARAMKVSKVAIWRYERNLMRPSNVSLQRLRKAFKVNGEFDRFL